jgi:TorA maturation chaperone TorD
MMNVAAKGGADRPGEAAMRGQLLAYADDLRLLARLHGVELTADLLHALQASGFPDVLILTDDTAAGKDARALMSAALDAFFEDGTSETLDALHADFAAIYLNHSYEVSPLECVWLDPEGLILQEPTFEIRRWYAHYGLRVPNWRRQADDHLAHQLEFIAHLLAHPLEHGPKDAAAFMDHHVLRWIEPFAARVANRCQTEFYAALAVLTAVLLNRLRDELERLAGMPRIELEPIEEERKRRRDEAQQQAARFVPGAAPSW